MTIPEINALRKGGKTQEAYDACKALLERYPDDRMARTTMAWCIKSLAESHARSLRYQGFATLLHELASLRLGEIGELGMANRFSWDVKTLFDGLATRHESLLDAAHEVFEAVRHLDFIKPDRYYTLLIDCFAKVKQGNDVPLDIFCDVADWWGLDNFLPDDYKPIQLKNGKSLKSVAERVYSCYYKALVNCASTLTCQEPRVEEFVKRLDVLSERHPEFEFTLYYKAQLLILLGRKSEALDAIRPFVRLKQRDFWVWDLLSDTMDDSEIKLSCLCRALSCHAQPDYLGKVRLKAAQQMASLGFHDNARTEIDQYLALYQSKGWHISDQVLELTHCDWYQAATPLATNAPFYCSHVEASDNFLYQDMAEQPILITHVNKEKKVCHYITANREQGFFSMRHLRAPLKLNEVYLARLGESNASKKGKRIFTYRHASTNSYIGIFYKPFKGKLNAKSGNNYGFVNDVFVDFRLVEGFAATNGTLVSGMAVISFNPKRQNWGWRAISIANTSHQSQSDIDN